MVKILKSGRTDAPTKPMAAFNAEDLREQARLELERAQVKADRILEAANTRVEELYQATKAQALADAQQDINSAVAKRAEELIQIQGQQLRENCESLLNGLQKETQAWLADWSQATIRISRAIAEKVLQRELSADTTAQLESWIKGAVEQVRENRELTLELNPEDQEIGSSLLETLSKTQPIFSSMKIRTDAGVEQGGCRLTSPIGSVDCQLTTQLDRIEAQLLGHADSGAAS